MDARLSDLVRQLRASGFAEVAGARASVTLPIDDRLVRDLVRQAIPPEAPVRELDLHALDGDRLSVRVRLAKPAFLPPIGVTFHIAGQPSLPDRPVLVLQPVSGGALLSLASSAIRFFGGLPPGVRLDGERIAVDLRELASRHGGADVFTFLEHLELHAESGRFVAIVRAAVPPR